MVDFVSGTQTVFQQSTSPTGWTKTTTSNECTIRVVSGAASSGGSVDFSTAMATQVWTGSVNGSVDGGTGATALASPQLPSHTHGIRRTAPFPSLTAALAYNPGPGSPSYRPNPTNLTSPYTTGSTGVGDGHSHPITTTYTFSGNSVDFGVNYVDIIIASKD